MNFKKKIILSVVFFNFILVCHATNTSFDEDFSNKFYTFENKKLVFKSLTKEEFAKLNKVEKKNYTLINKAQKALIIANEEPSTNKNIEKYNLKALKYNPYLWIAYNYLGEYYYNIQKYISCIEVSDKILIYTNPKTYPFYYNAMGLKYLSYYNLQAYEIAYDVAMQYINSKDNNLKKDSAYFVVANSLLIIDGDKSKNYTQALNYANKNLSSKELNYKLNAHKVRYKVYCYQNNIALAEKEALAIVLIEPSTENYINLAQCTNNRNDKIECLKKAKELSSTKEDFNYCFVQIAKLEQSKIDEATKRIGLYVKAPNWREIYNGTKYGTDEYWYKRIDKFFLATNNCIKEYKGANLVACFNQVNLEQEKLTKSLEDEIYRQQQLSYQQLIYRQQLLNYYENVRPKTYTVTPIGNSIYIDQR